MTSCAPLLVSPLLWIGAVLASASAGAQTVVAQVQQAAMPSSVRPACDRWIAHQPNLGWSIEWDSASVRVRPEGVGWEFAMAFAGVQSIGGERMEFAWEGTSGGGDRVAYRWGDALEEWFVNAPDGLEHGFTVHQAPIECETWQLCMDLEAPWKVQVGADSSELVFLHESNQATWRYSGLRVWDALGRELPARLQPRAHGFGIVVQARGAVYPVTVDPVLQRAILKASNVDSEDAFGTSVDIDGDWVVVGAPNESSNSQTINAGENNNAALWQGAAYVYHRVGSSWVQDAYLKAPDGEAGDRFGSSVALSGDTIVAGAIDEDGPGNSIASAGAAYVFRRVGGVWQPEAVLTPNVRDVLDSFGLDVAIDGDRIAVAAFLEDSASTQINTGETDNSASNAGAVYVFARTGSNWVQEAYLKAPNAEAEDYFGISIALDADTLVVGSAAESAAPTLGLGDNSASFCGAAYVFRRTGSNWNLEAYLKAPNGESGDLWGNAVALAGDTLVMTAPGEDGASTGVGGNPLDNGVAAVGAAWVWERSGSTWTPSEYLKPPVAALGLGMGDSVAINGDRIVIGAYRESNATGGTFADPHGSGATQSGAAFGFRRFAGAWQPEGYLKASFPDAYDNFARALAISGDWVVSGAPGESSASALQPLDNGSVAAGAAYLFEMGVPEATYCSATATNSAGLFGTLRSIGSRSVSLNNLTLVAESLPNSQFGFFLNSPGAGNAVVPIGSQGTLCLGGGTPIGRHNGILEIRNSGSSGSFDLQLDLLALPTPNGPFALQAGQTWNFQAWYRDTNPGSTSNFTEALSIQFE